MTKRVPDDLVDGAEVRAAEIASMSEQRYQNQIIELARKLGWGLIYHTYNSRRSAYGFPDLILLKAFDNGKAICLALEVKSQKGRVRPGQREWIETFSLVDGVISAITRPLEWDCLTLLLSADYDKLSAWKSNARAVVDILE